MANKFLQEAKESKNDEFYTLYSDIENELKFYKNHFKGKIIYCNADDPYKSNFFKYFVINFNSLGLEKLIATCYSGLSNTEQQFAVFDITDTKKKRALKIEIKEVDICNDDSVDITDVDFLLKNINNTISYLKGNGDFRSEECVECLKEADIVVTNPPFSLFREYIGLLMKHDKKFLVIGAINIITYKDVFPLIKDRKLFLGVTKRGTCCVFEVPDHYKKFHKIDNGKKIMFFGNITWFTNLDHGQTPEKLDLHKRYYGNEHYYPKYENYDAINVDRTLDIPIDYDGVMGVPISFINKWNPDQFEIITLGQKCFIKFTKNKAMEFLYKGNPTGKIVKNAKGNLYRLYNPDTDKYPIYRDVETGQLYTSIYARVLIKRKY